MSVTPVHQQGLVTGRKIMEHHYALSNNYNATYHISQQCKPHGNVDLTYKAFIMETLLNAAVFLLSTAIQVKILISNLCT